MTYLLRLDLERLRTNLERTTGVPHSHEDVLRLLAGMKVWRHDDDWFTADENALRQFIDDEVLDRRTRG
jgi:hypothetical protein